MGVEILLHSKFVRGGCVCTCSRFESNCLCWCDETLELREAGSTMDVVAAQTKAITGPLR